MTSGAATTASVTLDLRFDLAAPPDIVFAFLSQPDRMAKWLDHGSHLGRRPHDRVLLKLAKLASLHGSIRVMSPNIFVAVDCSDASHFELALSETDAGCTLTLKHGELGERFDGQRLWWLAAISRLADQCARHHAHDAAAIAVANYLAAWNEADSEQRKIHLESCWAETASLNDQTVLLSGRDALNAWIGHTQELNSASGTSLSLRGEPQLCRGSVRFSWEARLGERILSTGLNIGRLDRNGRFLEIVGFWN